MLLWSIKVSIISLLFILLIHNLITFLKSTLTVPKIKDLVKTSSDKYQKMFDTLSHNKQLHLPPIEDNQYCTSIDQLPLINMDTTIIDDISNLSIPDQPLVSSSMKNELKTFLKSQMNNDVGDNSHIETYSSNNNYASL